MGKPEIQTKPLQSSAENPQNPIWLERRVELFSLALAQGSGLMTASESLSLATTVAAERTIQYLSDQQTTASLRQAKILEGVMRRRHHFQQDNNFLHQLVVPHIHPTFLREERDCFLGLMDAMQSSLVMGVGAKTR